MILDQITTIEYKGENYKYLSYIATYMDEKKNKYYDLVQVIKEKDILEKNPPFNVYAIPVHLKAKHMRDLLK